MKSLPGFERHDHTQSIYGILVNNYRIELSEAHETIDVVEASPEQASILHVDRGALLFEIRRTTWDSRGAPVEYSHDLFRTDRLRISMQRYGARWKRIAATERASQSNIR